MNGPNENGRQLLISRRCVAVSRGRPGAATFVSKEDFADVRVCATTTSRPSRRGPSSSPPPVPLLPSARFSWRRCGAFAGHQTPEPILPSARACELMSNLLLPNDLHPHLQGPRLGGRAGQPIILRRETSTDQRGLWRVEGASYIKGTPAEPSGQHDSGRIDSRFIHNVAGAQCVQETRSYPSPPSKSLSGSSKAYLLLCFLLLRDLSPRFLLSMDIALSLPGSVRAPPPDVPMFPSPVSSARCQNLTEKDVTSYEEAIQVLDAAVMNRSVAATAMNAVSSRSHMVVQVSVDAVDDLGQVHFCLCPLCLSHSNVHPSPPSLSPFPKPLHESLNHRLLDAKRRTAGAVRAYVVHSTTALDHCTRPLHSSTAPLCPLTTSGGFSDLLAQSHITCPFAGSCRIRALGQERLQHAVSERGRRDQSVPPVSWDGHRRPGGPTRPCAVPRCRVDVTHEALPRRQLPDHNAGAHHTCANARARDAAHPAICLSSRESSDRSEGTAPLLK